MGSIPHSHGVGTSVPSLKTQNRLIHKVIVLDRLENRLQLAREFGADHTINIEEFNTPETRKQRIQELTDGRLADIVMELVGQADLLIEGIDYLTYGGTFVEIGDIVRGRKIALDPSPITRGKKVMGSISSRRFRRVCVWERRA